jgi:hypothetical protein
MGLKPLPTQLITYSDPHYYKSFTDTMNLVYVEEELKRVYANLIDPGYFDYLNKIIDPLERALYIAVLHGLYANVSI